MKYIKYEVHRSVEEEKYTAPDTRKQEDALIAAKVAKTLEDENVYRLHTGCMPSVGSEEVHFLQISEDDK